MPRSSSGRPYRVLMVAKAMPPTHRPKKATPMQENARDTWNRKPVTARSSRQAIRPGSAYQ